MNRQRLKTILILFVIAYGVISGFRVALPWIHSKMFNEEMKTRSRALVLDGTAEAAKRQLLQQAQEFDLPVNEDNLVVIKDFGTGRVLVEARYRIIVVLPFGWYTHTIDFQPRFENVIPEKMRKDF